MTVEIKSFQLQPPRMPSEVRMILADNDDQEKAKVWIEARYELPERDSDRLPLLVVEALERLQTLIAEGREHFVRPPRAPNR